MKRILSLILLFAVLVLSLAGCDRMMPVEYCELAVVLNIDFETYDSDGAFDTAYSDGDVIMGMTRYSFVDCEDQYGLLPTLTPEKLAEVYRSKSGKDEKIEILKTGDVPYYYYSTSDGLVYLLSFYRTPYAYFVVTYITPIANFDTQYEQIIEYMESAYILENHL